MNWLKVGLGTAVYLSLMHAVIEAFIDKNTTPLQWIHKISLLHFFVQGGYNTWKNIKIGQYKIIL